MTEYTWKNLDDTNYSVNGENYSTTQEVVKNKNNKYSFDGIVIGKQKKYKIVFNNAVYNDIKSNYINNTITAIFNNKENIVKEEHTLSSNIPFLLNIDNNKLLNVFYLLLNMPEFCEIIRTNYDNIKKKISFMDPGYYQVIITLIDCMYNIL